MNSIKEKFKNSIWAKRIAKIGGAYLALELILVVLAVTFFTQTPL